MQLTLFCALDKNQTKLNFPGKLGLHVSKENVFKQI